MTDNGCLRELLLRRGGSYVPRVLLSLGGGGHVQLGKELDVAFHTTHLHFHIMVHLFPLAYFPLELIDPHAGFIPARSCALPIALASLLLPPYSQLLLRHGRDGGRSVVVLGLVEEGRLFLHGFGLLLVLQEVVRDLALLR